MQASQVPGTDNAARHVSLFFGDSFNGIQALPSKDPLGQADTRVESHVAGSPTQY